MRKDWEGHHSIHVASRPIRDNIGVIDQNGRSQESVWANKSGHTMKKAAIASRRFLCTKSYKPNRFTKSRKSHVSCISLPSGLALMDIFLLNTDKDLSELNGPSSIGGLDSFHL